MNLIYLHGFRSSPQSIKGQQLKQYAQNNPELHVHLPDLNMPPLTIMAQMKQLIEQLDQVVLVGSSLGGFYATQLVAEFNIPAVLINPAMRPWELFRRLFQHEPMPFWVNETWSITEQNLLELEQIQQQLPLFADKLLVLLQQGDEILDYREAQRYYSDDMSGALLLTDMQGSHAMDDFEQKIPLILQFLTQSIQ